MTLDRSLLSHTLVHTPKCQCCKISFAIKDKSNRKESDQMHNWSVRHPKSNCRRLLLGFSALNVAHAPIKSPRTCLPLARTPINHMIDKNRSFLNRCVHAKREWEAIPTRKTKQRKSLVTSFISIGICLQRTQKLGRHYQSIVAMLGTRSCVQYPKRFNWIQIWKTCP